VLHGDDLDAERERDRRVACLGEVWTAYGRGRDALRRLLRAEIKALRSGPDLLGMVIRCRDRHYIFLNDRLPRQAPIIERIVLAHEAVHVVSGVEVGACCQPKLGMAMQPAEWQVWVRTLLFLVPAGYAKPWLAGESPEAILARFDDPIVTERMVEWRGLMEIAEGRHPGDPQRAQAEADRLLRDGLTLVAAAAEILHGQEPVGYPSQVIERTARILVRSVAAAIGLVALLPPELLGLAPADALVQLAC
jgi:hypothetical protein